jgi:hypothetical protein
MRSVHFSGAFKPDTISPSGKGSVATYTFNPATFAQEYQDFFGKPLAVGTAFNNKQVYNATGKRTFLQKMFRFFVINLYQGITRFMWLGKLSERMHKTTSKCPYKIERKALSCSEFGLIVCDQIGGTWKGFWKAMGIIKKRLNTCGQAYEFKTIAEKKAAGKLSWLESQSYKLSPMKGTSNVPPPDKTITYQRFIKA